MNSNKLFFACISDLTFLPFAQKGETFFHSKPQLFNFWSNLIVKLHIFLPLSISQSQFFLCLLNFSRKIGSWTKNPHLYVSE